METQAQTPEPLRVIKFTASNVKRVRAVEIEPTAEGLVIISGKNGEGKSSTLDALWLVLGGREASKGVDKVIREGADSAEAEVDLGKLIVRRRWKRKDGGEITSTMEVRNKDGAKFERPQSILDSLFEVVALDPAAFAGMTPAEQVEELIRACDEEETLAALDEERAEVYERRTEMGRKLRSVEAEIAGIPEHGPEVPDEEYSTAEIVQYIDDARQAAADYTAVIEEPTRALELLDEAEAEVVAVEEEIEALQKSIAEVKEKLVRKKETRYDRKKQLTLAERHAAQAVPPPDIEELKAKGDDLDALNAKVREKNRRLKLEAEATNISADYDALTASIQDIDAEKRAIITGAKLPVEGLSFTEDGVTVDGIPFTDCAESLKLRIATGLAMALNPTLRVIRITNGHALDSESMEVLRELAEDRGYQVWVERIEDKTEGSLVIVDGLVAGYIGEDGEIVGTELQADEFH
jgi:DNA repair exonuclease SbcCD ATPase subunit